MELGSVVKPSNAYLQAVIVTAVIGIMLGEADRTSLYSTSTELKLRGVMLSRLKS